MLQKILVAVDKSDLSLQALESASDLARSNNAELRLVHVLDNHDPEQPSFPYISEFHDHTDLSSSLLSQYHEDYRLFINKSWAWLNWQTQQAIDAGVAATCDQPAGAAGPSICAVAKEWNADLVVIGSRGLTGLKELLLGSVSNYVVHHAPCSVYVIHPKLAHAVSKPEELVTTAAQ